MCPFKRKIAGKIEKFFLLQESDHPSPILDPQLTSKLHRFWLLFGVKGNITTSPEEVPEV